jgi:hypothetical protein
MGMRIDVKSALIKRVEFDADSKMWIDHAILQYLLDKAPKGTRVRINMTNNPVMLTLWQKQTDESDGWELVG